MGAERVEAAILDGAFVQIEHTGCLPATVTRAGCTPGDGCISNSWCKLLFKRHRLPPIGRGYLISWAVIRFLAPRTVPSLDYAPGIVLTDCVVQRPGGIRGWGSAMLAFDSTRGFPGEGPEGSSLHKYFTKPTAQTATTPPAPAATQLTQPPQPTTNTVETNPAATATTHVVSETETAQVAAATTTQSAMQSESCPEHPTIYSNSRQYMAEYDSSGNRWRLCSYKPKRQIGSRKSRGDAVADLSKLDAGTHKSQNTVSQLPAAKRPCRRASAPAVVYAAPTREGNYKAGLGRGNKMEAKRPAPTEEISNSFSPSKAARKLIDSDCQNPKLLRSALCNMVNHCANLKRKLGAAASKVAHLARLLAPMASATGAPEAQKCCRHGCKDVDCTMHSHSSPAAQVSRELIGQGYNALDTGRTLRRHRLSVMTALEKECGQDRLKQYEVACAVVDLFKQSTSKRQEKLDASRDAVVKGLETTFATIAARSTGSSRYTTKDRIVRDALTTAIMMAKPDDVAISSMIEVLGGSVEWRALKAALGRAAAFKKAEADIVRDESSAGAYNANWEAFVKECWLATTRESERKSDEKYSRTEKKWYRVRWLEQKFQDVLDWVRAEGVKKFGPDFCLSSWKLKDLMPWFVRKPGRETCMCRYHMEFDHFCDALRRWKQAVRKELTPEQAEQCVDCPVNSQAMRQYLQCSKDGELYKPECSMRHRLKCRKCSGKLEALFSNAERAASPNLTYQKWSEVPYHCKDGRVLSTRDFVSTPVTIEQFESDFAQCIESFLPHHTRAQVADQEWDYLWDHVHEFPNSVACVTDFSNSYLHKHKYEHMQQFWCEVSATLLGCVMRIPIDNLADCYMPAEEKSRLRELLSKEGLPPLVTITHVLITPNPHHDTATVQHFWKEKLFPWIWDNTVGLEGGNMFVRSDNCGGQFKSGRHFRFISEHSSLPHSRGVRLLWSHFESCHGKDLSDPECGRCKFCLKMEEMRHTRERPTEMKTSREAFGFLRDNCESTDRSIFEKKGVGIYKRQFHWADSKEIKPLHRLAEVKTVHGSDSWHMFYDTGHVRHILVREIACFSCDQCKQMKWRSCSRLKMCGPTMSKEVILESANRVDAPLTASRITQDAKEMAKAVVSGAILGVECASEQEPYILVRAASQLYQHQGDDEYTWMGWIRAGDWLIDVVKFEKYSNTESFWCLKEEKRFPIFEEDLRSVITGYEVVKTRQSGRSTGAPPPMRVEVAGAEISKLQERVLFDLNSIAKEKDRPRRPSG